MSSLTINEVKALTEELIETKSSIELKKSWLVEGALDCLCKSLAAAQNDLIIILRAFDAIGYRASATVIRTLQQEMKDMYFSARDMINILNKTRSE